MSAESMWTEGAERFMSLQHVSQERALHPTLARLVDSGDGHRLLDYGCGDGRILVKLSDRWQIDAYDPSDQMRRLARRRVGHRLRLLASSPAELADSYDAILLGMVLLCIPDATGVLHVLQGCASRMHCSSRLFLTTTHPCFRSARFSNFTTAFGEGLPFRYMDDGAPVEVALEDPDGTSVSFTDYHWSLGFTVDALRSQGLVVTSLVEVPDDPTSSRRNPLVPPFLIVECRKGI